VTFEFGFRLLALGDVARRAHRSDDHAPFIEEGRLVHIKVSQAALEVAELLEYRGSVVLQRDCIAVLAEFAEGVPLRVVGMTVALPLAKNMSVLPKGSSVVGGVQELPAERPIGEQVALFKVLGPDHVRHVVRHPAQQRGQEARALFALAHGLLD
jgi:hypothetical protein